MTVVVLLALLAAPTAEPGQSQPRAAAPAPTVDPIAEAYGQFLLAHRLEDADDIDGAVAALRRAMALDPASAQIPAELADLYMRRNRAQEAIAAAEQAVKIDPSNRDAHRVLGTIYGSLAFEPQQRGSRQAQRENVARAVRHLEQAAARPDNGGMVDANVRAMLGRLYVMNGDNDKAIPVLAELVKQEPGWQDGAGLLVEAYAGAGRQDEAVAWLTETAPDNPQLYATLADLHARNRRWAEAGAAYEQALDASRSPELRIRYASMLMNAGGKDEAARARDVLRELSGSRAADERVLYLLTQAERRAGDLEASESTARRLIAQNAKNPRGYVALAETLEEQRQYEEVVQLLGPALAQFRAAGDSQFALALLLPHLGFAQQQIGRFDEAIAAFEEVRKLAPRDVAIAGYLIQAHLAAKNFSAAADLARAARADRPEDLRLARLEAAALMGGGKQADGIALLEEVVRQHAGDFEAHIALAQAYSEADREAQAISVLQDAQAKFPAESAVTFQLGALYEKQRKFDEAEAAFRQVIAREPEHAAALNYLGYMLADRGERLAESVELIKRALALEPHNGSYLDSLGWAYFRDGKLDLARDYLKRAADQLVTNSVVQDHYGDVLFSLGRVDEAIAAWTRALEGDGDSIDRGDIDRKIRTARQKRPRQ